MRALRGVVYMIKSKGPRTEQMHRKEDGRLSKEADKKRAMDAHRVHGVMCHNRNATLANALSVLAKLKAITITQNFLQN